MRTASRPLKLPVTCRVICLPGRCGTCQAAAVTRDGAAVIAVWTPELDDYLEAVRARNKAHHANRKMTVIVGLCLLAVVAGWVAGADWLMGFGISGAVFGERSFFSPRR
jgi:hypothetical protein